MLQTDCFEKCKLNPDFSPPLLHRRFVDDKTGIFLEKKSGEIFMDTFNKLRPHSIQDTFSLSNTSAIFMDIEYFKGPRFHATGFLDTRSYQKPKNNYLYIPPFSAHSKVNMQAVILSTLKGYCMFNTSHEDFLALKILYYNRLLDRGYTPTDLFKILILF